MLLYCIRYDDAEKCWRRLCACVGSTCSSSVVLWWIDDVRCWMFGRSIRIRVNDDMIGLRKWSTALSRSSRSLRMHLLPLEVELRTGASLLFQQAHGVLHRGCLDDWVLSPLPGPALGLICSGDRTTSCGLALTFACIGGGYWSPDARALVALRNTIDKNPQRLKDVLMNDKMRAEFLSGSSTKTAVKSFVKTNSETALKTKPKVSSQHLFAPFHR